MSFGVKPVLGKINLIPHKSHRRSRIFLSKMPKRNWSDDEDDGEECAHKIRCLDDRRLRNMEERRLQLLDQLPPDNSPNVLDPSSKLIEEWLDVLKQRDNLIRDRIYRDNQKMVVDHLSQLHELMITIGRLDHSETPKSLKLALCHLHRELEKYDKETGRLSAVSSCDESELAESIETDIPAAPPLDSLVAAALLTDDLDTTNGTDDVDSSSIPYTNETSVSEDADTESVKTIEDTQVTVAESISDTMEIVYEVLPASIKCIHEDEIKPEKTRARARTRSSSLSRQKKLTRSTSRSESPADLRRQLLSGKQNLKSTPGVKRSPGGTPERKSRPLMMENPNDLVTYALQKKFQNVRQLYTSPTKHDTTSELEDSLSISID